MRFFQKNTFRLLLFSCLFLICSDFAFAQNNFKIKGHVIDAATKEGMPFATVVINGTTKAVSTDIDGNFTISSSTKIKELKISSVSYKTVIFTIKNENEEITIPLQEDSAVLQEVVVKPKKYRNKNNPTVELIKRVIDNRNNNRVEGFESYQEEQYEKVLMGLTNLSDKLKNKKMFQSFRAITENTDTTLLKGSGITPAFLQESLQDFYSQKKPKRSKIWVKAQKKVKFPFIEDEGIERYMRYLYQESDIYDDYIVLLSDHFISPIADNAPIFYRYYPADTTEVQGSKIARIEFFPRNKNDLLLQGEIYVALDSTYPVTRINYTVNPNANLNWVRKLEMDQSFEKLPTGKWVLAEETYILDFGVVKTGMGVFAKRYVSHRKQNMGVAINDTMFKKSHELRSLLPTAEKQNDAYWQASRHIDLTETEVNTYKNVDSVMRSAFFQKFVKTAKIVVMGHIIPIPGLEIGRVNNFYSFNPVEGTRIRFGARTNPQLSKRFNFETYAAYGFRDERWKYGISATYCLAKDRAYNRFPYNMIRVNYQQDLVTPGVLIVGTFAQTSIASSFTRGTNDRFLFQKKFVAQYDREYYNHFSITPGFEHRVLSPLGSLKFNSTDDASKSGKDIVTATPFIQLRYAPEEEFYQTETGWRRRIRFKSIATFRYARGISGIAGSQYNYDEVTASLYRFFKVPPIGYNYFYVEAGGVFGKVPYPLLTTHRANQTFGYRFMAYNLMNFMEFVSDRYVTTYIEHNFYGSILNKVPLIKKLKLREFVTFKALYGQISEQNQPQAGSNLYELPTYADGRPLTYSLEKKPYIEGSIGLGNIFKVLRVDLVRRFTYLEHPETAKYGVRLAGALQF